MYKRRDQYSLAAILRGRDHFTMLLAIGVALSLAAIPVCGYIGLERAARVQALEARR